MTNKCPLVNHKKEGIDYENYLQLEMLLQSQKRLSPYAHDEMLFIIIHQVYELWFKQILFEIDYLNKNFQHNKIYEILHTLKRIRSIFKIIVSQMDVLETMSSSSFNEFRSYLGSASGFQSYQFRELEKKLGIKKSVEKTVWISFLNFLRTNQEKEAAIEDDESLLISIYHSPSLLTEIAELLLDIDEGFQEWRYRHVKLVERMIGFLNPGTGGSSGAEYLRMTLNLSFCSLLWTIKHGKLNS